jgi:type VI secretion system protein ImpA
MLGPIRSREDAFGALIQVGEFLRRSEPQSLVPYAIEELVRRGRMALPELMGELIKDAGQRKAFYLVAGIRPPEEQK